MKTLTATLLIFSLLISGGNINASPDFTLEYDSVSGTGFADKFEFVAHNNVINHSDEPLEMVWERIDNAIPTAWESAVCDNILCHETHVSTSEFTVQPGDSALLDVHFRPHDNTGSGKVEVVVYPKYGNKEVDGKTASFYGEANTSTNLTTIERNLNLSIYPNPVQDQLNINFARYGNYQVEIFNVLGKAMIKKSFRNQNNLKINVSDFPEGVYMLTVTDKTTNDRLTKRFTKD